MKRGALVLGLAAIALLSVLCVQRWSVGSCDFEQKIITPDGMEFPFTGPRIVPGSLEADWPLEGEGLPQVEHISQEIYGMPGALFKGTVVKPRVLTITLTTHGLTRAALHDIKARMQAALRWDRGDPGEPSIYRYTINGVSRDLYVHYDGEVRRSIGRPGLTEVVGIRMIAYDPMWYDPATQEQVLDWGDAATMWYYAERVDGRWIDTMTQPASVAVGPARVLAFAIDPVNGDVYIGGRFADWDNNALSDNLVRWVAATDTWENVGDDGLGGPAIAGAVSVWDLKFGPGLSRTLYVAGTFTNAGGVGTADYLAQVNVDTDTWADVGGGPGAGAVVGVYALAFDYEGRLLIGGNFTDWRGDVNADRMAAWDGAAWANLGSLNGTINTIEIMPNGNVVAGGAATTWGGVAANRIAEYDGAAWAPWGAGLDNVVQSVAVAADGTAYVGGLFTTAGGIAARGIARWNGAAWSVLGTGLNNDVYKVAVSDSGMVYVGGLFTTAGGLTLADRVARWNGFSWAHLDIDLAGANAVQALLVDGQDLYVGTWGTGTAYFAGDNAVVNLGNAFALPVIEIKNYGLLRSIRNEMVGGSVTEPYDIPMNMQILDGEIVTIDLSSGVKSATSTWRPLGRLNDILPASDMATFCLESGPRANYGGEGGNLLTLFIADAAAREHNDGGNQLSGWDNITGIAQSNTDLGRLYASIVVVGGGFNRVDLYSDAARTLLVGHTADYNGAGAQAIIADNASGLGGTITIDAVGAADVDIFTYYTVVTMTWKSRWWDLDTAVS